MNIKILLKVQKKIRFMIKNVNKIKLEAVIVQINPLAEIRPSVLNKMSIFDPDFLGEFVPQYLLINYLLSIIFGFRISAVLNRIWCI